MERGEFFDAGAHQNGALECLVTAVLATLLTWALWRYLASSLHGSPTKDEPTEASAPAEPDDDCRTLARITAADSKLTCQQRVTEHAEYDCHVRSTKGERAMDEPNSTFPPLTVTAEFCQVRAYGGTAAYCNPVYDFEDGEGDVATVAAAADSTLPLAMNRDNHHHQLLMMYMPDPGTDGASYDTETGMIDPLHQYPYLETITEESSDDLRSEESRSEASGRWGWDCSSTDGAPSSIIHVPSSRIADIPRERDQQGEIAASAGRETQDPGRFGKIEKQLVRSLSKEEELNKWLEESIRELEEEERGLTFNREGSQSLTGDLEDHGSRLIISPSKECFLSPQLQQDELRLSELRVAERVSPIPLPEGKVDRLEYYPNHTPAKPPLNSDQQLQPQECEAAAGSCGDRQSPTQIRTNSNNNNSIFWGSDGEINNQPISTREQYLNQLNTSHQSEREPMSNEVSHHHRLNLSNSDLLILFENADSGGDDVNDSYFPPAFRESTVHELHTPRTRSYANADRAFADWNEAIDEYLYTLVSSQWHSTDGAIYTDAQSGGGRLLASVQQQQQQRSSSLDDLWQSRGNHAFTFDDDVIAQPHHKTASLSTEAIPSDPVGRIEYHQQVCAENDFRSVNDQEKSECDVPGGVSSTEYSLSSDRCLVINGDLAESAIGLLSAVDLSNDIDFPVAERSSVYLPPQCQLNKLGAETERAKIFDTFSDSFYKDFSKEKSNSSIRTQRLSSSLDSIRTNAAETDNVSPYSYDQGVAACEITDSGQAGKPFCAWEMLSDSSSDEETDDRRTLRGVCEDLTLIASGTSSDESDPENSNPETQYECFNSHVTCDASIVRSMSFSELHSFSSSEALHRLLPEDGAPPRERSACQRGGDGGPAIPTSVPAPTRPSTETLSEDSGYCDSNFPATGSNPRLDSSSPDEAVKEKVILGMEFAHPVERKYTIGVILEEENESADVVHQKGVTTRVRLEHLLLRDHNRRARVYADAELSDGAKDASLLLGSRSKGPGALVPALDFSELESISQGDLLGLGTGGSGSGPSSWQEELLEQEWERAVRSGRAATDDWFSVKARNPKCQRVGRSRSFDCLRRFPDPADGDVAQQSEKRAVADDENEIMSAPASMSTAQNADDVVAREKKRCAWLSEELVAEQEIDECEKTVNSLLIVEEDETNSELEKSCEIIRKETENSADENVQSGVRGRGREEDEGNLKIGREDEGTYQTSGERKLNESDSASSLNELEARNTDVNNGENEGETLEIFVEVEANEEINEWNAAHSPGDDGRESGSEFGVAIEETRKQVRSDEADADPMDSISRTEGFEDESEAEIADADSIIPQFVPLSSREMEAERGTESEKEVCAEAAGVEGGVGAREVESAAESKVDAQQQETPGTEEETRNLIQRVMARDLVPTGCQGDLASRPRFPVIPLANSERPASTDLELAAGQQQHAALEVGVTALHRVGSSADRPAAGAQSGITFQPLGGDPRPTQEEEEEEEDKKGHLGDDDTMLSWTSPRHVSRASIPNEGPEQEEQQQQQQPAQPAPTGALSSRDRPLPLKGLRLARPLPPPPPPPHSSRSDAAPNGDVTMTSRAMHSAGNVVDERRGVVRKSMDSAAPVVNGDPAARALHDSFKQLERAISSLEQDIVEKSVGEFYLHPNNPPPSRTRIVAARQQFFTAVAAAPAPQTDAPAGPVVDPVDDAFHRFRQKAREGRERVARSVVDLEEIERRVRREIDRPVSAATAPLFPHVANGGTSQQQESSRPPPPPSDPPSSHPHRIRLPQHRPEASSCRSRSVGYLETNLDTLDTRLGFDFALEAEAGRDVPDNNNNRSSSSRSSGGGGAGFPERGSRHAPRQHRLEAAPTGGVLASSGKAISMLSLRGSRSQEPREKDEADRARSMEFLLDAENKAAAEPPENQLMIHGAAGGSEEEEEGGGGERRALSQHELRVRHSLQRLDLPDWFKNSPYSRGSTSGFLLRRHDSSGGESAAGSQEQLRWQGISASRTPSASSLASAPITAPTPSPSAPSVPSRPRAATAMTRVPPPYCWRYPRWSRESLQSPGSPSPPPPQERGQQFHFPRWSSSASSTSPSPTGSLQRSFFPRQPYLGWRSSERLTREVASANSTPTHNFYRSAAERLSSGPGYYALRYGAKVKPGSEGNLLSVRQASATPPKIKCSPVSPYASKPPIPPKPVVSPNSGLYRSTAIAIPNGYPPTAAEKTTTATTTVSVPVPARRPSRNDASPPPDPGDTSLSSPADTSEEPSPKSASPRQRVIWMESSFVGVKPGAAAAPPPPPPRGENASPVSVTSKSRHGSGSSGDESRLTKAKRSFGQIHDEANMLIKASSG